MATASSLMTTEELLAIPEDGTDRWLIAGEAEGTTDDKKESLPQSYHDPSGEISR